MCQPCIEAGKMNSNPGMHIISTRNRPEEVVVKLTEYTPNIDYYLRRAGEVANAAWQTARLNDHDMQPLQDDTEPGTFISYCTRCDGFLSVDLIENVDAYGRATESRCPGHPPVRAAARRSVFDMDLQSSGAHNEPVEANPTIDEAWLTQWSDPETTPYLRRRVRR